MNSTISRSVQGSNCQPCGFAFCNYFWRQSTGELAPVVVLRKSDELERNFSLSALQAKERQERRYRHLRLNVRCLPHVNTPMGRIPCGLMEGGQVRLTPLWIIPLHSLD